MFVLSAVQLSVQAANPAFPGAQGFGAISAGGRGGQILHVTNLNDSGAGSLRACVEASGPRICVFDVGGTISLASQLRISNPYITIAGQTAPGDGITIKGLNVLGTDPVRPATHDIVVQYIRIGIGHDSGRADQTGDAVSIYGEASNAIFDHVSLRWGQDETFQLWNNGGSIHNITLSNSLLADPNSAHSTFLISGAQSSDLAAQVSNNDWHHNLLVSGSHRIPLDKAGNSSFINNIVYNYGYYASQILGGGGHDYIGNIYKPGPWSMTQSGTGIHEIQAASSSGADALDGSPSIYVAGNIGWHNGSPAGDQSVMMARITGENGGETGAVPAGWLASARQNNAPFQINVDSADTLDSTLLPHVGASRRLACDGSWVSMRDALDAGWIANYQTGTGSGPDQNSSFPTVNGGTPCTDSDGNSLPDAWEIRFFGHTGVDPNGDADGDGFTNIEEYLGGSNPTVADNGSAPVAVAPIVAPAPAPAPAPVPVPAAGTSGAVTYEAEAAALAGGAKTEACGGCSAGQAVGYIGNGGTAQFTVAAPQAGQYAVTIYYMNPAGAAMQVSANGGAPATVQLPGSGGWNVVASVTVPVALNAGANSVTLGNTAGWTSDIDRITVSGAAAADVPAPAAAPAAFAPVSLEAETATAAGAAQVETCACSGGQAVGYVGNNAGAVRFAVNVPAAGTYHVTIFYTTAGTSDMTAQIQANDGAATMLTMPGSGGWSSVASMTATLQLNAGANSIVYSNAIGWAPDIDRIVVSQ